MHVLLRLSYKSIHSCYKNKTKIKPVTTIMSALLAVILLPPAPPSPSHSHSSSDKIAQGLRRCCFAILTFLTYAHVPSVMLCVHHPITRTSEANSLLAAASFRSWVVIPISCYTGSQEQTGTPPPCTSGKQGPKHNMLVVNHN